MKTYKVKGMNKAEKCGLGAKIIKLPGYFGAVCFERLE